jgi:dTDP-4-amino-4,6-dideoxygalactose transaminase
MDSLTDVAKRHNLKIIEDAAHALPSNYKGKKIGSISDITVFSFYATKTITTAEGGMVVTNDPAIYDRIKVMRFHGIDRNAWDRYGSKIPKWYYEIIDAGFKYNMTDVAASLGIQQLKKVDIFYEKRRRIASIYDKELKSIDGIELPVFDSNDKSHSWHLYIIRLDQKKFNRNVFIEKLYEKGIGASVHFIPLHIHPYYRDKYGFKPEDFPVSYDCYKKVVSIPIYTKLNDSEIDKIISSIRDLSQ